MTNLFNKIYPVEKNFEYIEEVKSVKKDNTCLCKLLFVCFNNCKIFGLTPLIRKKHEFNPTFNQKDGGCEFKISKFWRFYDLLLVCVFCILFAMTYFWHKNRQSSTMDLIYAWIYLSYGVLMVSWSVINTPIYVRNLNNVNEFLRHGLMCNGMKKRIKRSLLLSSVLGNGQFMLQVTTSIYLHYKTQSFNYPVQAVIELFLQQIIHNIPFLFTYAFSTTCQIYSALFFCFNTYLKRILNQRPSNEIHSEHLGKANFVEHIDYARRLHEKLRLSMLQFNRSFNPQLLIHISIELLMIIIHLYSVIVFFVVKKGCTDIETTTNRLNILFIVVHIVSLVLLLYASQVLKCRQTLPMDLLNMFTTNHLSAEEYTQLRMFSTKLHAISTCISAGRLFTIDIELIAPLMGSIVTYLLVALQFQWPAKMNGLPALQYNGNLSNSHLNVNTNE